MIETKETSKVDEELNESLKSAARVIGKHVLGNLYNIKKEYLTDAELIEDIVKGAAKEGNMHILDITIRKFNVQNSKDNGGVSVIAIIEESHIAIHTWPESNFATVDIYSCGESSDPESAFAYMVNRLKPKDYKKFYVDRSN